MRPPHLLQTLAAHPSLAAGIAPDGLLHPAEQVTLAGLRALKRRRDWLLGRWTAKHLVQQHLAEATDGEAPALAAIVIAAYAGGAPYAALAPAPTTLLHHASGPNDDPALQQLALSLSISHSGDRAFCALTDARGITVGADIERIEARQADFAARFFSPAEIAALQAAPPGQRQMLTTAIWSAKEAVLKALRLGLRVDTRSLTCLPPAVDFAPGDWTAFRIERDAALMGPEPSSSLAGWWRCQDGYVLTLATHTLPPDLSSGPGLSDH